MAVISKIPTTADIYIEVDSKKVAVVQSYKVTATRQSGKNIWAFGQDEPVATVSGADDYRLELTRIYATDSAIRDDINFYELKDFSFVVCKEEKNIIYSGCQWVKLEEGADVGGNILEKVTISAATRKEIKK